MQQRVHMKKPAVESSSSEVGSGRVELDRRRLRRCRHRQVVVVIVDVSSSPTSYHLFTSHTVQ